MFPVDGSLPRGAPLPSDGSQRARFPTLSGITKALRLPVRASPVLLMVSVPSAMYCSGFVVAEALPVRRSTAARPGEFGQPVLPLSGQFTHGHALDLSGFLAIRPIPLPCSQTPAGAGRTSPFAVLTMLPPVPTLRRLQREHDFEAHPGLLYLLPTLHGRRCRRSCKARFRLAGCASTGRGLNPLDRSERFQATSVLLSRTSPDASWVHMRRAFHHFYVSTKSPIAADLLARVASLYAIEAEIRGHPAEHRRQVRQARSRPIVEALHAWLQAQLPRLPHASDLAKAMRYALKHWPGLVAFLDDGRIEMDTNVVERAIRPNTLNRKNALFAGSDGGARHWAIAMTLIQTAKLNGVDPMAWLTDVLERVVSGRTRSHELANLLPWNWQPATAAAAERAAA